ncbi:hypothetical protein QJS66_05920 [Kocuria rhizophila]|nr:hypothetical protein QJS66_05920 [Kocuria rhizophila]
MPRGPPTTRRPGTRRRAVVANTVSRIDESHPDAMARDRCSPRWRRCSWSRRPGEPRSFPGHGAARAPGAQPHWSASRPSTTA